MVAPFFSSYIKLIEFFLKIGRSWWMKQPKIKGVQSVLTRDQACNEFELPADRIGDIIIVSDTNVTIGTSSNQHDLDALVEPLRSHGGVSEQKVPFIINSKLNIPNTERLRNFDAFYYATLMAE